MESGVNSWQKAGLDAKWFTPIRISITECTNFGVRDNSGYLLQFGERTQSLSGMNFCGQAEAHHIDPPHPAG
jgi:hypothetical protein